jgi:hypothetical protein
MIRFAMLAMLLAVAPARAQEAKKDYCSDEEAKAHLEACKKDYKGKTDDDHTTYIDKLGEKRHPKILEVLTHFLGRGSVDVQIAAGKEIGKYAKEAKASEALISAAKAASAKKDGVTLAQKLLFQAGQVAYRPNAKQLHAFFGAKVNVDISSEAIQACGKHKSKDSIEPLIQVLREIEAIKEDKAGDLPGGMPGGAPAPPPDAEKGKRKQLVDPTVEALFEITQNSNKPRTAKDWEEWWRKNKASFKEQAE